MEEMKNLCRLCLCSGQDNMVEIFGEEKIDELIKKCIGIQISCNPILPDSACKRCLMQLNNVRDFIEATRQTESYLLKLILSHSDFEDVSKLADEDVESFDLEFLAEDDDALQALALALPNFEKTLTTNSAEGGGLEKNRDDSYEIHMEIDVLDSDLQMVSDLLGKNIINGTTSTASKKLSGDYSCLYCKSLFNDFNLLTEHMHSCDRREKKSGSYKNIRTDIENEDVPSIYRCKQCKKIYLSRMEIYNHAKTHVKSKKKSTEKFRCRICGDSYGSRQELNRHCKLRHDIEESESAVYRCKVCKTIFTDRKLLYTHVKQHASILEKSGHLCDACGKSFNSLATLGRHALSHVNERFECKLCSKKFATEELLKSHDNVHDAERRMCEMCGLILPNDTAFRLHLPNHK